MPRPARVNISGIPQHVTQRGNNRQVCFFDNADRRIYLELLHEAALRRDCSIHAYVLMTNHVHLLVTPNTPNGVSLLMQDTGREYVPYINKAYRRSGTLWEGRFKSSLVESSEYCLTCYQYIELNPVRAMMVKSPGDYPWSSYQTNGLEATDHLITPHRQWLKLGHDLPSRHAAYRRLFEAEIAGKRLEAIRHSNRKGLPLGCKRFRAEIESQLNIKLGSGKVGRPPKKR